MRTAATDRIRVGALTCAVILVLGVAAHAFVGWARHRGPGQPPAVNPTVVVVGLVAAALLTGWSLMGRARDRVTARIRAHHPERWVVLATADLPGGVDEGAGGGAGVDTDEAAWDDPGTAPAWQRACRSRLVPPLALAAAALLLLLGTGLMSRMASAELHDRGVRTPAQVTASGWTYTGLGHSPWVRVTHVEGGRTYASVVHGVDPQVVPVGTQLTVVVDPDDPETVGAVDDPAPSAVTQWWQNLLRLPLVVGLGWAGVAGARMLAWRSALRSGPWQPWRLVGDAPYGHGHAHGPGSGRGLDLGGGRGRDTVLELQDWTGEVSVVARSSGAGLPPPDDDVEVEGSDEGSDEVAVLPGPPGHPLLGRRLLVGTSAGVVEATLPRTVAEETRLRQRSSTATRNPLP
ncbi:DUF3592 domain-containing protein [Arsenicicoccus sp. UBA7492]|uniref:DUF3592 domain-containing protein n=1 Tax=Arsenicicoccus sp. UBA7492 TaxID=1946057 RepID=UPI00257D010E|nr:DUF3592 domain-containing protein [Arsenicicoccus sp. UBA7492]